MFTSILTLEKKVQVIIFLYIYLEFTLIFKNFNLLHQFEIENEKNNRKLELICAELEQDEKLKKESLKAIKVKEEASKKAKKKKNVRTESSKKAKSNNDTAFKCKHQAKTEPKIQIETFNSLSPSKCQILNKSPNKSPTIITKLGLPPNQDECKCDDENDFIHKSIEVETTNNDQISQDNDKIECNKSCCFDIINYWNKLVEEDKQKEIKLIESKKLNNLDLFEDEEENKFELMLNNEISQQEIDDYYANRDNYLENRIKNRIELQRKFELLKSKSNLKIRLRNF